MISIKSGELIVLLIVITWVIFWKGYAVWTAAREGHKRWFIALLIVNTFSILDIFYLLYIAKKKGSDIKSVFKTKI